MLIVKVVREYILNIQNIIGLDDCIDRTIVYYYLCAVILQKLINYLECEGKLATII